MTGYKFGLTKTLFLENAFSNQEFTSTTHAKISSRFLSLQSRGKLFIPTKQCFSENLFISEETRKGNYGLKNYCKRTPIIISC